VNYFHVVSNPGES